MSRSQARLGEEQKLHIGDSSGCGNGDKEVQTDGYGEAENKDNVQVSSLRYWGEGGVCVNDNGVRWADISKAIVAHI